MTDLISGLDRVCINHLRGLGLNTTYALKKPSEPYLWDRWRRLVERGLVREDIGYLLITSDGLAAIDEIDARERAKRGKP